MPLSSTSTIAEIRAELKSNADWYSTQSVTKARNYVTAARHWLWSVAKKSIAGTSGVDIDTKTLYEEINKAEQFIAAASSSGRIKFGRWGKFG